MRNKLMAIKNLISKEHQILVTADHLNKVIQMDQMYLQKLSEIGVENLIIKIEPDKMIVSGSFEKDIWKGEFKISLKPDKVVWDEKHILFIQILDHNVKFEKSFRGILANIGNAIIESVFGKDFIVSKLVAEYENDLIRVDLDSASGKFYKLLSLIIVKDIRCEKDKLILLAQSNHKQAFKNAGAKLRGLLKHKVS